MSNPHAVELLRRLKRGMEHVSTAEMQARQAENYASSNQAGAAADHARRARIEAEEAMSEFRRLKRLIDEMQ